MEESRLRKRSYIEETNTVEIDQSAAVKISGAEFDKVAQKRKPADAYFHGALRGGGIKGKYWYTVVRRDNWKVPIKK